MALTDFCRFHALKSMRCCTLVNSRASEPGARSLSRLQQSKRGSKAARLHDGACSNCPSSPEPQHMRSTAPTVHGASGAGSPGACPPGARWTLGRTMPLHMPKGAGRWTSARRAIGNRCVAAPDSARSGSRCVTAAVNRSGGQRRHFPSEVIVRAEDLGAQIVRDIESAATARVRARKAA